MIDMFEVGQTVWDVRKGRGKVVGVGGDTLFKIRVAFNHDSSELWYTLDGKFNPTDLHRSLYFSEPSVSGATTAPFTRKTKDGDTVVLRSKTANGVMVAIVVSSEDEYSICDRNTIRWTKSGYTIHKIGEEIY